MSVILVLDCARCGCGYERLYGEKLTKYCDNCAHIRVEELEKLISNFDGIRQLERAAIERTLTQNGWHVMRAVRELGIGRATLYRRLEEYGLRRPPKNTAQPAEDV